MKINVLCVSPERSCGSGAAGRPHRRRDCRNRGWRGINIYTNYFNHVAATDIDFPKVDALSAARS